MLFLFSLLSVLTWLGENYNQSVNSAILQVHKQRTYWLTHRSDDSLAIQYINLEINPLLLSEVKKYIKAQQDSSLLFKSGFGYIMIDNIKSVRNGRPIEASSLGEHLKDIELEFDIGLSSLYPHQGLGVPLYYSFVQGRLVLIYDQKLVWIHRNRYSITSQRRVKELIKQTLLRELRVDFVFKGLAGDSFMLSAERRERMSQEHIFELGSFTLDKLKTVVQYVDGSISYRYR